MTRFTQALGVAATLGAGAVGVGWLGLQFQPSNFPPPAGPTRELGLVQFPDNLPSPVRRYFETVGGVAVPRVETAVVWGRCRIKRGVWAPGRVTVSHVAGESFRRDIELTWFGQPILKVIDQYVNGRGSIDVNGQVEANDAIDQGSNHILWVEAPAFPSIFLTDPRIRWEAIDDTTARLVVPFKHEEDSLTVAFNPQTGLIDHMTTMRYKASGTPKIPWRVDYLEWSSFHGVTAPRWVSATWGDEDGPWFYMVIDGLAWNVDMSSKLPQSQPATA